MAIEIIVKQPMVTFKTAQWGRENKELFFASQEAIRHAVQNSSNKEQLKEWLDLRKKLSLEIEFHLKPQRADKSDLDSLLADLFNPLVEGACGPRAAGKPIPQTKDALFWKVTAIKVKNEDEKIIIRIAIL